MQKGFSLIEIIVYLSILSILMVGVFSSVLSYAYEQNSRSVIDEEDYKMLLKNFHDNN